MALSEPVKLPPAELIVPLTVTATPRSPKLPDTEADQLYRSEYWTRPLNSRVPRTKVPAALNELVPSAASTTETLPTKVPEPLATDAEIVPVNVPENTPSSRRREPST